MEKKKKNKDDKFTSAAHEPDSRNEPLSKEEQNQAGVAIVAENGPTDRPSHENASCVNQQYLSIIQWPYTSQYAVEHSSLISRPSVPTQTPSPVIITHYQQLPHQQTQPTNHQVQQVQPPPPPSRSPHLSQTTSPFWIPQRPVNQFSSTNVPASYQPLTPLGTEDANGQASTLTGGGTLSRNQPHMPGFCFGYPYPGFPGPWDPLSWWCQTQKSQPHCTYAYPGVSSYFSSAPQSLIGGSSATMGQSSQGRTIQKLSEKLSQKHQQLWASQWSQNIQLWTVVGQLQSELADYKNRLLKLEAELSSAKPVGENLTAQNIGTILAGQQSKRGRLKRPIPSNDPLPSLDESHPRARGRKPAVCKVHSKTRTLNFEKQSLQEVEDKGKANHSSATRQQEDDGKMASAFMNSNGNIEIDRSNPMMPPFHGQVQQDIPGEQVTGIGLNSSSEMKTTNDKPEDQKTAFSILYPHVRDQIKTGGTSGTHTRAKTKTHFEWPSNISFEESGKNMLNTISQGFFDNGCVMRQVEKVIPEWSFVHEDDATRELEDGMTGPGKNNDEDMDDAISGAEDCSI